VFGAEDPLQRRQQRGEVVLTSELSSLMRGEHRASTVDAVGGLDSHLQAGPPALSPAGPTSPFELFELLLLPEPPVGIEPTTCSLRVNRSAD
jgi:hypothetical protein